MTKHLLESYNFWFLIELIHKFINIVANKKKITFPPGFYVIVIWKESFLYQKQPSNLTFLNLFCWKDFHIYSLTLCSLVPDQKVHFMVNGLESIHVKILYPKRFLNFVVRPQVMDSKGYSEELCDKPLDFLVFLWNDINTGCAYCWL